MLTWDAGLSARTLGFISCIQESNKTFSWHIVLKRKDPYDGAMVKLRHQQPSLWNRGLAEDIEDLWEPWMRLVEICWRTSSCWTRFMKPRASAIRRAAAAVACKLRPRWCYACCC